MINKLVACWHILMGHSVVYNVTLFGGVDLILNPNYKGFTTRITYANHPEETDQSIPAEPDKWS